MPDRYTTKGNPEGEFQPGSNDQVLRNKLGIAKAEEMDDLELEFLCILLEAGCSGKL